LKKVLILTISTGGGHNEVARNLRIGFEKSGYEVAVMNSLEIAHPDVDTVVSKSYSLLADKLPTLYGKLYYGCNHKPAKEVIASTLTTISSRRNHAVVKDYQPDLIIATHPFPVPIIAGLKKRAKIKVPLISIITDFFPNSLYIDSGVDAYIVGSYYTKKSLVSFGIPRDKIFAYGIPIKEEFYSAPTLPKSHETLNLLLAGGSMGMSGIETILEEMINLDERYHISVLCGTNEKLCDKLIQRYSYAIVQGRLKIYGFITNVSEIMDQSHIMITKPGGLTTSECLKKGLPMIIPYYIPGQEEENLDFLLDAGLAEYVPDPHKINEAIVSLADDEARMQQIAEKMQEITQDYSVQKVVQLGSALIQAYE
jgi:processive 1,2-diacylglycerol beta-glucosyltransferase